MDFKGKKVIVTGGTQSIGRKIALSFAELGADVVISYHSNSQGAEETVQSIRMLGRSSEAFSVDCSQISQIATFAEQAISSLGRVDILINNAAMVCREKIFELTPEKMQQVFQVNTVAPLYLTQLCAKNMKEQGTAGCILNISSISANMTMPRGIGYGASKAALNKLTRHAALDLAPFGIRVNAIAPGVVEAGMNEETSSTNPQLWKEYMSSIPLRRAGTPDDIANLVIFMASEKAQWITGKIIEVDGGHVI